MDLHDRIAVVTGASAGIGRAIAVALAAEGMRVAGLARSEDRLDALATALGDRFLPVACDVTDGAAVERAFAAIDKQFGAPDVLVNNAGYGLIGPLESFDADAFDAQMAVNVRGMLVCTQHAVKAMRARTARDKGRGRDEIAGHIVNVASIAGLLGNAGLSAYNASKFAVRGFSEAWMKELRADDIKVTCLYPGSVDTEFAANAGTRPSGSTPKGEPMQPEDIAATVVHVVSAPARYLISEVVMRPLRPA